MDMQIDLAIQLLEEAASTDLEACATAIRADDKPAALAKVDQALAKLSSALDALRDIPRAPQELGLPTY